MTMPRLGDERGIVADLAPLAGRSLAPGQHRDRRSPKKVPENKTNARGARPLLTMSLIFSWFGP
jgi:hypothetical protein